MGKQFIGDENTNVEFNGGASFNNGLGAPIRDSPTQVPKFNLAGKQISVNPVTGRLEVWDNNLERWIDSTAQITPKVYKTDITGVISNAELVGKVVVGIMGAGSVFTGGITSEAGYDFYKEINDAEVTFINGSLAAETFYTLIFG